MPKIFNIALTGGPCGGKTEALSYLKNKLGQFGAEVFILAETATELMQSGISPHSAGSYEFHRKLFERQLKKENQFVEKAKESKADIAVILCDRGLLDNKAYVTDGEFMRYSARSGLGENQIRCRYDAVFHLVTAAEGAEENYNLDNYVRSETPQKARELDKKLLSLWVGAPHLRIIDNSTGFEQKLERLFAEVKAAIGIPKPLEIERKFLIEYPDLELLNSLDACRRVPVTQAYLTTPEEGRFRIRSRGKGDDAAFIKTVKNKINELTRVEEEKYISEKEYLSYLNQKQYVEGVISKDRYCIAWNSSYFELDIYPFFNDRATLEIELLSENQPFNLPDFVKVIREVSFEREYKNKYLAVKYGK